MKLNKHESFKSCPIPHPKHMPNPNPGNAQVKDITLAARIPTHKGK